VTGMSSHAIYTRYLHDALPICIEAPTLLDEEPQANERPDNDIQWTRIVELDFVPHPRLERPEIIKMDYGMTDGSIRMRVRAAVAGYMLLRWSVDCSPDHRLKEEQYRLWLSRSEERPGG